MSYERNRSSEKHKKSGGDVVFYQHSRKSPNPPTPSRPSGSRKLSKKRKLLNTLAVAVGVLLILGGTACLVAYTYFHRINYQEIDVDESQTSHTSGADTSGSEDVQTYSGQLLNDPMVLNVLLFGEDTRSGMETGNSDTMVLLSVDTRHQKIKMLSFMRDTYVEIPGHGENRINAAYTLGGAALTVSTIQKNYGIKIDRYAVVDFSSFRKIIDVIGGLDVELTAEEVDYINWQYWINRQTEYKEAEGEYKEYIRSQLKYNWFYLPEEEKPINKNTLTFKNNGEDEPTAIVHLNGSQTLWHARNRGEDGICSGDDFTRTKRQREVISLILNSLKKSDVGTLLSIIYEIGPLITTNVKTSEITDLAGELPTYLKYPIISEAAPAVNTIGSTFYFSDYAHPVYINGVFSSVILIADWNDFRQQVAEFIYEEQVRRSSSSSE